MEHANPLQQRIGQALIRFVGLHFRMQPQSIWVDIHERSLVVTLEDIVPPVERDYARDNRNQELIDQSYSQVFACMRHLAENEVEQILDQPVKNSIMRVDTESGNAYVVFNLAIKKE